MKFLHGLVRSLEVRGVDSSASVADAVDAVCAEDVCVKACFERGEKTPYIQATQQAVLHVARQIKASSCAVSEGNAERLVTGEPIAERGTVCLSASAPVTCLALT